MGSPRRLRLPWTALAVVLLLAAIPVAVYFGGKNSAEGGDRSPARALTVGFTYVGSVGDRGYNQAAYEGSLAMRRAVPGVRLLQAENVPESATAELRMEAMIARGATVIVPTSFGHLASALDVAGRHPDVTFLHMGGLQTADNLGTFFGNIWEVQYAAGQAAGLTTRTDRLGYVAAYPIAQSLLGVNAYQRGARSVNPRVRTRVLFTSSWCDPARQRRTARRLLAAGADVLGQHQDCTRAVLRAAAAAGAKATGYHFDARDVAPRAWLTGAAWNWGPLLADMVRTVRAGGFSGSPYARRYRGGVGDGIVRLASFGETVDRSVRRRVRATYLRLKSGELHPFDGPVRDQRGSIRILAGERPDVIELEETDYLAEGIDGRIPVD